ncbi:putative ABC transporter ATP-binding protein YbhF [mine drainage metagenome]|uniref:Putative ABC transporter ATP-binding protein YbhF n=1 Tax=mine drainage metagenome TaxID=410659 RepID=A0A1J5QU90_9ZZZZ
MSIIATHELTKRYGDKDAVHELNLEIDAGEVFGFLGPNGAGKTTTIRLLLGLIQATSGSAEIFGLDTKKHSVEIHKRLAYVPGESNLWGALTGKQTVDLLGALHGQVDSEYRKELVERFQLDPIKKVRAYSKGNRQKLLLIAGLSSRSDVLLLDEPTSGLDPLMQEVFRKAVLDAKERGQTVFLSSHTLSEVEVLCDRVALLRNGELIETGTLDQMRLLSALTYQITFADEPVDLTVIENIKHVLVEGRRVTCEVTGKPTALLKLLAGQDVVKVVSHEPSLEEIFLSHYGN